MIISETSVINVSITQSIVCPSVDGWEFTLKALDAPLGSVSTESYWMTPRGWGTLFFSPPLKCSAYSDLAYCGAHKWPSEEKGWGQGSDERLPSGRPLLLSNLWRHKKSNSLIPKGAFRRRKEVIGELFLCVCHLFSSSGIQVFILLCTLFTDYRSWLVSEAEPAGFYIKILLSRGAERFR